MRIVRTIAAIALLSATIFAVEPVELKEQPWDEVALSNGGVLEGTVIELRTDGTLRFKPQKSGEDMVIPPDGHKGVSYRRPAPQVAGEALKAAIANKDRRRLTDALRWSIDKGADAVALEHAAIWLKTNPGDRDVLALAVPLWKAAKAWPALEAAARAGMTADRNWGDGDELVVEALAAQGRNDELKVYARDWLSRNPTALRANLICGASFEAAGDARTARECYRKAWELGKSSEGAIGFARTSLATANFADTQRATQALIAAKQSVPEAKAYGGAAAAALADLPTAKALLEGFAPDALPGPAAQAGAYALGLIAFREDRMGEAAKQWQAVQTPSAQLALAIAQRREFAGAERLAPEQRPLARTLNAAVRLENKQAPKALELIDQHLDGRHALLYKIGQVVTSGGSIESVRALSAVRTPESSRWQLYGHLIAGRYDEADQLARTFPANDGYAMSCRVFLAAARGDPEGARMLYQGSGGLPGAPGDYAKRLAELYNSADDQFINEPFDWPTGEVLATGWEGFSQGSGIGIRADGGKLVMEGIQTAQSEDPITRAVTIVPGSRFRLARLAIDISAIGRATAGLELLDGARKNGVAIAAVGGSQRLSWRQLTSGKWSGWTELPYAVDGTVAIMSLDFSGRRVFAADPTDPLKRTQLSEVLARSQGEWSLGVFGTAEAGVAWRAGFDDLRWQLKPER